MDPQHLGRSGALAVRDDGRDAPRWDCVVAEICADRRSRVQGDELEPLDRERRRLLCVHECPDDPFVLGSGCGVDRIDASPAGDERRGAREAPTLARRLGRQPRAPRQHAAEGEPDAPLSATEERQAGADLLVLARGSGPDRPEMLHPDEGRRQATRGERLDNGSGGREIRVEPSRRDRPREAVEARFREHIQELDRHDVAAVGGERCRIEEVFGDPLGVRDDFARHDALSITRGRI
jgi:hypothetical protein